ncbi:uncharacterized protein J4E84_002190 [Alternaria hordeiaustralica]|uniref:uncharacterized protein n=1 Tax=Alternaria hordeiaustralica TaxID=1187925 RepID=UPI0020C2E1BA|nr:uncharacterized protein J4E84_002190 [Alternaria hordeiaustralica]KAI4693617.1 hypothetical protein J4E84_002190 [Alternaria hordeiaustralica]
MQAPQKDQSSPSKTAMEAPQQRPDSLTMDINALRIECELYLNSFPGRSNLAPNTGISGCIAEFLEGKFDDNDEALKIITKMVSYRNTLTRSATKLLTLAGIFKPNGLDCADFDFETFQESQDYKNKRGKYEHAFRQVARFDRVFFPPPDDEEGRPWVKPVQYVAAALMLDDNIDSSEEIADAVQRITSSMYMSLFILQWR